MFKISLNVFFWPLCKHEAIYWSHYCFTLQKLGKSIRILLQNALHTVVWSSGPKKIPWLHNLSGAVLWHRNLALPEDTTASLLWDRSLRLWSQILNHCKPTVPLSALSFLFPLTPVSLLAFQPFSPPGSPFAFLLFPVMIPISHCLLFLLYFISPHLSQVSTPPFSAPSFLPSPHHGQTWTYPCQ